MTDLLLNKFKTAERVISRVKNPRAKWQHRGRRSSCNGSGLAGGKHCLLEKIQFE
jgi:hypothetical protein